MTNPKEKVLLTGASGYLGRYVVAELTARGVPFVTAGRGGADVVLDLRDAGMIAGVVTRTGVDRILNCAAMSKMGDCADDPDAAMAINARAVEQLGAGGVRLIQVSTDLVFDGDHAPYASDAVPDPRSAYGRSKRAGEIAALRSDALVVRVPLLFGPSHDGRAGATDMLRSVIDAGRRLQLYDNEYRTPAHVAFVAASLVDLVRSDACGVVHVAGAERVSRYELAERYRAVTGCPAGYWESAICDDPTRPRDVSLIADHAPEEPLDTWLSRCVR